MKGIYGLLNNKIIAIVGSRNCTEYGRKYAQKFAKELAKQNITIISGLALGIDTAAHNGAVNEVGNTIAVLGGGLKNIYPSENLWLYNKIISQKGCVITEYSEQAEAKPSNFPKRNRIISGIADAVLVIEASYRSGSKITAKYAKLYGKNIYCIPINLDQKNSSGIVELVKEGAKIITNTNQLIQDLYKDDTEKNINKNVKKIPSGYKEIYNILEKEMSAEEIAQSINQSISEINYKLTMMEIEGYVEQTVGNSFIRKEIYE